MQQVSLILYAHFAIGYATQWKSGQLKAIRTYNAHLAIANTTERIEQLTDTKKSAEQSIETFDAEFDAIQKEKEARKQKNSTQNKQSSYAENHCTSASPGGKDPKDRDKERKEWKALTNKEARELAESMGFREKRDAPFNQYRIFFRNHCYTRRFMDQGRFRKDQNP